MTHALIEKVQAELAKRVPKIQQYCSLVVVGMQTTRSMILERTLGFLHKVLNAGSKCVSGRLVEVMCDSISSLCLVRECRELEKMCGVAFPDREN